MVSNFCFLIQETIESKSVQQVRQASTFSKCHRTGVRDRYRIVEGLVQDH